MSNGGSGIPLHGRENEYAVELWLDGPSAFWLHPEGPLSDTTPDEWMAKRNDQMAKAVAATGYGIKVNSIGNCHVWGNTVRNSPHLYMQSQAAPYGYAGLQNANAAQRGLGLGNAAMGSGLLSGIFGL